MFTNCSMLSNQSKASRDVISQIQSEEFDDDSTIGDIEIVDNTSTKSGSKISEEEDEEIIREQLAKEESTALLRLRIVFILILVITTVSVSISFFKITKKGEEDEFVMQYNGAARKVIESFEEILTRMGAVSSLVVANSVHSADHNSDWPFVTLSNFQQRARNAMHLSGALFVSISPIITEEILPKWEDYVNGDNSYWIKEGFSFQEEVGINNFEKEVNIRKSSISNMLVDPLHYLNEWGESVLEDGPGPYLPIWQTSPSLKTKIVNENLMRLSNATEAVSICLESGSAVLGGFVSAPLGTSAHPNRYTALFATLRSIVEEKEVPYLGDPMANLYFPVYDVFDEPKRAVVAVMTSIIHWRTYFRKILPSNINGIIVVLENSCHGAFTYEINGDEAYVIGKGDHHDNKFDNWARHTSLTIDQLDDGTASGVKFSYDSCQYYLHVYPSQTFYDTYNTQMPLIITLSVSAVFLFIAVMFLFYDRLVERRQRIVVAKATQSTAIVSSLFPEKVRDRLMQTAASVDRKSLNTGNKGRLKTFINGSMDENDNNQQPIADLFPHCTVLFADICGFTAWSSSRDPPQVFILLQRIYQSFDTLAKRRNVFKVETIGDSYVAVTGLPEPQEHHAIVMSRFAWECLLKLNDIVQELEVTLGPDTGNLSMRFGLHSGPVTAGVLRGDRARFQLFGDTVNTASRMESTGVRGKIQVSQSTADLIVKGGKTHWLKAREEGVKAKGKGVLKTYFIYPGIKKGGSSSTSISSSRSAAKAENIKNSILKSTRDRFIEWMVELLAEHIKKIVYVRSQCGKIKDNTTPFVYSRLDGTTCLDEVTPIMEMPKFDAMVASCMENADNTDSELEEIVLMQLREYVTVISSLYKDNPFHNFEHACHVTMSVNKLLKRIVAPDLSEQDIDSLMNKKGGNSIATHLHDYTHGINSDPLMLFALTFSALIHDVDHRGVSNLQLIQEAPEMSVMYRNKSIAEQNSLDIAWDLLMMEQFNELRCCLFASQAELMRFRQLIVNVVLATDIFDKELNDLRKARWKEAFSQEKKGDDDEVSKDDDNNLRATIVIEHIIQASDVAHTMQHWHVYQKWNENLFQEMYEAFCAGRMEKDPCTFWYEAELGFLDNYVIPLAKKLKECAVFGVSSDEYLNYAEQNRAEWEICGQEVVEELRNKVKRTSMDD